MEQLIIGCSSRGIGVKKAYAIFEDVKSMLSYIIL